MGLREGRQEGRSGFPKLCTKYTVTDLSQSFPLGQVLRQSNNCPNCPLQADRFFHPSPEGKVC